MRYFNSQLITTAMLALAISCWLPGALATTCLPQSEMIKRADMIFAATPRRISLEPPGVSPPEIAIHRLASLADAELLALDDLRDGETFEITQCYGSRSNCRTWSGTVDDLPAQVIDPWYETELAITRVWKGSLGTTEVAYSTVSLEFGREYIFVMRERGDGTLVFGGPCYRLYVFPADRIDLPNLLGMPDYTYDHESN